MITSCNYPKFRVKNLIIYIIKYRTCWAKARNDIWGLGAIKKMGLRLAR